MQFIRAKVLTLRVKSKSGMGKSGEIEIMVFGEIRDDKKGKFLFVVCY